MKHLIRWLALTLALACAGQDDHEQDLLTTGDHRIDEFCDQHPDDAICAPDDSLSMANDTEDKWCIGCLAGVSAPRSIAVGYGLQPITQTVGGQSLQFPACYGTEGSMPHNCRTPTGNAVWFAAPPSSWSSGTTNRYWDAVATIGAELSNAGWSWGASWNGNTDPWDTGSNRYKHTEVIPKAFISNSPHPLFKLTLQGVQNTPNSRLKTYLACDIEFDLAGPKGINNNGGHCTGGCTQGWSPADYDGLRQIAFLRALSRCIGLGGDGLPIYEHQVGSVANSCWSQSSFSCSVGGGDGMLRREWFPAGWWQQRFWKNCQGNNPQESCDGIWPAPMGSEQFLSGGALLWQYLH